jgi:hypothetical protein
MALYFQIATVFARDSAGVESRMDGRSGNICIMQLHCARESWRWRHADLMSAKMGGMG